MIAVQAERSVLAALTRLRKNGRMMIQTAKSYLDQDDGRHHVKRILLVLLMGCLAFSMTPASAESLFPNVDTTASQSEDYQTLYLAVKCLDSIVVPYFSIDSNIAEIRSYCAYIRVPTTERISYECNQESVCLVFEINFNDLAVIQIVSEGVDIKVLLPYCTSNKPAFSQSEDTLEIIVDGIAYYVPCEDFIALFEGVLIERVSLKLPSPYAWDELDAAYINIPVGTERPTFQVISPDGTTFFLSP